MPRPRIKLQPYVPGAANTLLKDFAAALETGNDHFYGLYIIRSNILPERYRFGASGVSHSNQGSAGLRKRLNTHAGATPTHKQVAERKAAEKPPFNQTEMRRPWSPHWACTLAGASGPITLIAEGIIGLCLVENGYEMCVEPGEHSMFVKKDESANLNVVIDCFYLYFTNCAAVLGYDTWLPAGPVRLPAAGALQRRSRKS